MKAQIWAIKTRSAKATAWMPAVCCVHLDGEPARGILIVCGFTTPSTEIPGHPGPSWKRERLEKYLGKIERQWHEEYGKGWKLEIRDIHD